MRLGDRRRRQGDSNEPPLALTGSDGAARSFQQGASYQPPMTTVDRPDLHSGVIRAERPVITCSEPEPSQRLEHLAAQSHWLNPT